MVNTSFKLRTESNMQGYEVNSFNVNGYNTKIAILMWIATFGGLHIDLDALQTAENIPESSGLTGVLIQAGVATSGKADSFLKAPHVNPTRRPRRLQLASCT